MTRLLTGACALLFIVALSSCETLSPIQTQADGTVLGGRAKFAPVDLPGKWEKSENNSTLYKYKVGEKKTPVAVNVSPTIVTDEEKQVDYLSDNIRQFRAMMILLDVGEIAKTDVVRVGQTTRASIHLEEVSDELKPMFEDSSKTPLATHFIAHFGQRGTYKITGSGDTPEIAKANAEKFYAAFTEVN